MAKAQPHTPALQTSLKTESDDREKQHAQYRIVGFHTSFHLIYYVIRQSFGIESLEYCFIDSQFGPIFGNKMLVIQQFRGQ